MTPIIHNLTRKQAVTRMQSIQSRMETLGEKHRLGAGEQAEWDDLRSEFDTYGAHVEALDAETRGGFAEGLRSGRYRIDRSGLGETPDAEATPRDSALRTLDRHVQRGALPSAAAEVVEQLVERGPARSRSWAARWAVAAGADDYRTAFAKRLASPEDGHLLWSDRERDAWRTVVELNAERAMGLTDTAGGFMVPLELDPAIRLSNAGTNVPILEISRVIQTVSDVWQGVTSAGVVSEWLPESDEAADATPTLASPSIPNYKLSSFVPYSVELEGDAVGLLEQLSAVLLDSATHELATALTVGTGSGQPTGIVTALAASAGGASIVAGDGAEVLAVGDFFKLQNALGPRWQPNARFMASLPIWNAARRFDTGNGGPAFPGLDNIPATLLGRPAHENSVMDSVINAAATEANYVAIYGDFSNYVVTVRAGSSLELLPNLVGANRRPTGQRGAWLWGRYGADSIIDGAFKMLNVPTTA